MTVQSLEFPVLSEDDYSVVVWDCAQLDPGATRQRWLSPHPPLHSLGLRLTRSLCASTRQLPKPAVGANMNKSKGVGWTSGNKKKPCLGWLSLAYSSHSCWSLVQRHSQTETGVLKNFVLMFVTLNCFGTRKNLNYSLLTAISNSAALYLISFRSHGWMPADSVHLLLFILFYLLLTLLFEINASLFFLKNNKPTLIIFNIYKTPSDYDWNWNMKPASQ